MKAYKKYLESTIANVFFLAFICTFHMMPRSVDGLMTENNTPSSHYKAAMLVSVSLYHLTLLSAEEEQFDHFLIYLDRLLYLSSNIEPKCHDVSQR